MSHYLPRVLIVGGDSLIGNSLYEKLKSNGLEVKRTTRNSGSKDGFELSMETIARQGPPCLKEYDAIVIMAALTSQSACEFDPETAYLINVEAPKILATAAISAGTFVLFPSTNLVLGGDAPFLNLDAPLAPTGAYARLKAEAELGLLSLAGSKENLAIFRMTKVLEPQLPLLQKWRNLGERGEEITAFSDLLIAPVSLVFVVNTIAEIIFKRLTGFFHCSGLTEVSYAEFARAYLQRLEIDPSLVRCVLGRVVNPTAAASPRHASLSSDAKVVSKLKTTQPLFEMLNDISKN